MNSKQTCFVDTGVYTRNRLFRLLGSKKFGKPSSAALRIASANKFPFPEGFRNENFYTPEIASNIASTKTTKREDIRRSRSYKVRFKWSDILCTSVHNSSKTFSNSILKHMELHL